MKNKVVILKPWAAIILFIASTIGFANVYYKLFEFISNHMYLSGHILRFKKKSNNAVMDFLSDAVRDYLKEAPHINLNDLE